MRKHTYGYNKNLFRTTYPDIESPSYKSTEQFKKVLLEGSVVKDSY